MLRVGLAIAALVLCASKGYAQKDTAAVFVATSDPSRIADSKPLAQAIGEHLRVEGRKIVAPTLRAAPNALTKGDLLDVRGIGQEAMRDLADEAKASIDLAEVYQPRISQALSQVSSVQAADARALLWNLCILRVQLLIRRGGPGDVVQDMARDCRRMFVDQYDFGRIWQPEVVAAFRQASAGIVRVPLGVQSAPAGCTVLLNGAAVGVTPTRLDVQKGRQDVQLACDAQMSRIHTIDVASAQDVVIRLDGDRALLEAADKDDVTRLAYPTMEAMREAIDHAGALAAEAGAETFVLISDRGESWQLDWGSAEGDALSTSAIARNASQQERETAITALFRTGKPNRMVASTGRAHVNARPATNDIVVGGALIAGGVLASVFPMLALTSSDRCSGSCSRYQSSSNGVAWGVLGASAALVASGVSVLWSAPFGRRQHSKADVALGAGSIHLKGTFQ